MDMSCMGTLLFFGTASCILCCWQLQCKLAHWQPRFWVHQRGEALVTSSGFVVKHQWSGANLR